MKYLQNILIWVDVGVTAPLLGGSPYETLSGRIGKRRDKGDGWDATMVPVIIR